MPSAHLAIDLGASSGRATLGILDGQPVRVTLEELHRFEHSPCPTPAGPVWDLTGIWLQVLEGMRRAAAWCEENRVSLTSVGIDTWGVDWSIIGESGELLMLPRCYRDPQNELACQQVLQTEGSFAHLYERTGIQRTPFNTIFQLVARASTERALLDVGKRLLFLPDLLHFWLSGVATNERTNASTSSMLNVTTGDWDRELLSELSIPDHLLQEIIEPATDIGSVTSEVAEATGVSPSLRVVVPATHDTGSAIAAVPAAAGDESWAYLSSGTWSLLGAEISKPLTSDAAREVPFTNELGVNGTVRFLKNIAGLWLVQEVRRDLAARGETFSFAELAEQAEHAAPFRTLINPDEPSLAYPGNIIEKISRLADKHQEPLPETPGQLVRCCLESLSLSYRHVLGLLERTLGKRFDRLHIVGGGVNNRLLNLLTANAIERPVICGPVEATTIGNLLVQAMGCGTLADLDGIREVVRDSFELETIDPQEAIPAEVLQRYESVIGG